MRHITALVIKAIMTAAILFIILNLFNNYPIGPTLALSLLVTGLSYLIGDLAILPMSNNTVATVGDLILASFTIWLIGPFIVGDFIPFTIALLSSALIGVGEWFFHMYMTGSVLPRKDAA